MPVIGTSPTFIEQTTAGIASRTLLRVAAVGFGVALTAFASQFTATVPLTAVPFTLTPMVVLLTGAALGSRLGALTQMLYLVLGAAGAAVFAPSLTLPPGALRLVGPTGGYLLAYPAAAFVAGWLSERGWDRRYVSSLAAMLVGLTVIYVSGASWLIVAFQISPAAAFAAGVLPFLGLDLLKAIAAAMILPRAWRLLDPRSTDGH
jgi:biotin transport system substrate-specific component